MPCEGSSKSTLARDTAATDRLHLLYNLGHICGKCSYSDVFPILLDYCVNSYLLCGFSSMIYPFKVWNINGIQFQYNQVIFI